MSGRSIPFDQPGIVEHRQSTYWDLRFQEAGLWRAHCRGKKEHWFEEPGMFEFVSICSKHPLLADYQDPWDQVYLSGPALGPIDLIERLVSAVAEETEDWRPAERYLNTSIDLSELLAGGSGLLFRAPRRIGRRMAQALFEAGVRSTNLPYGSESEDVAALIMGRSFIIAERFEFENLSGAC